MLSGFTAPAWPTYEEDFLNPQSSHSMDRSIGRGRGRGRGFLQGTGLLGDTPVAGHTRTSGFKDFMSLDAQRRTARLHQLQEENEHEDRQQQEAEDDQTIRDRMSLEESRKLRLENEQHRKDVIYYFKKRVTLYLLDQETVKPGLSASSLQGLKKVLETIQHHQYQADENFSQLRRSAWFDDEDEEDHETWYNGLTDALTCLFDQVSEQERHNVTNGSALHSPGFPSGPVASSERYVPSVVEPIKLDSFNGTIPGTYRPFKTRFNLIMKRSKIDEALQAEHLLRCLAKEPLRIVMMIDLEDPDAIRMMWKELDFTYGNEQCDYQHHVTELQKLATYPPCRYDADLKELYYTFSEHIKAIRRISKNDTTGEDYKTTLCGLLPDYLKRKMYKLMQDSPTDYTLNRMMYMVGKQVGLGNMESAASGSGMGRTSGSHREQGNPWTKAKVDAERRAQACAGKLAEIHHIEPYMSGQSSFNKSTSSNVNTVTVGHETFSIPGPVAHSCYPVNRTNHTEPSGNYYNFGVQPSSCSVPPLTSYVASLADGLAKTNLGSPMFQANAAKVPKGSNTGGSSPWGNQTVSLNLQRSSCVFCNGRHGSLDCRAFQLGNQYIEILNRQSRCFNCFSQDHSLVHCTAESTCKADGCQVTCRHCPFFCGRFRSQAKNACSGMVTCSVDAAGNFENSRLHTVIFLLVNPVSGVETLVRGYLDSGCTDTFLLDSMARRVGLSGMDSRINFMLNLFGDNTEQGNGSLVKAVFKSLDGSYVSPLVACITKDALIQDVDSYGLSRSQWDCIEKGGYKLSDEAASADGRLPIDIVFGQDLYYQMIKGAPVHCPDGLVLVDTVFGHTLGGPVRSGGHTSHIRINYLKCQLPKGTKKFIDLDNFPGSIPHRHAVPTRCIPSDDEKLQPGELDS